MNLQQKESAVASLNETLGKSPAAFLVDYKGCDCASLVELRNELRPSGSRFAVIKNTLAKRAIADTSVEGLAEFLVGPTAIVWSEDAIVAPAKALTKFAKDNESLEIKGGVVDGRVVDLNEIQELAALPSKEELYAKLLSLLNAPATQLLRLVNAPASNVVQLIEAVRVKKESEGE